MATMPLDQRIALSPDVVYRTVEREAVVLHLDTGIYFGLNEVGSRIWELALEHDLRTVCDLLGREYDASAETIERDVVTLVTALLDRKLVVLTPAGPAR